MSTLVHKTVEAEIIKALEDVKSKLKISANINADCCPGIIGISSQILLNIMIDLEETLGVSIPNNIYIFHDPKTHKQLSVTEATQKLLKIVNHGE